MKAVLHFTPGPKATELLSGVQMPRIVTVPETDPAAFAQQIAEADVLLHVLTPVTANMMAMAPRLRLIQKIGVGVNTIDLEAAKAAGVAVANMPGTNAQAVAEHTLALMLATLRRVPRLDAATRVGRGWEIPPSEGEAMGEIAGRTVGFLGYGAIPQRLSPVLSALGAKVQFWNRSPRPDAKAEAVRYDTLIETSDILSLHVPLTPDTDGLLDAKTIARMRPGAIVINTARGELVDQAALLSALASGQLGGAGLDVFATEPMTDGAALKDQPNLVVTPHVAWLTPETMSRSLAVIVENCRRLTTGDPLVHRIV